MRAYVAAILSPALLCLAGCGNSVNPTVAAMISVSIATSTGATSGYLDAGQTLVLIANDTNDASGLGLNISLSGPGSLTTSAPNFFLQTNCTYTGGGSSGTATVTVTSKGNSARTASFVITFAPTLSYPAPNIPAIYAGKAYNTTIIASGGTGALTYAVVSGLLPAGLLLAKTGVLSGTPTSTGPYSFTIAVYDQSLANVGYATTFTGTVS